MVRHPVLKGWAAAVEHYAIIERVDRHRGRRPDWSSRKSST